MRLIAAAGAAFLCLAQVSSAQQSVQPQTTTYWEAWCKDRANNRLPEGTVTLYNGYRPNTGGHKHNEGTRPASAYGSLSSRGGDYSGGNYYPFTFTASRVGQTEWIQACCSSDCTTKDIQVRYSDISSYSGHSTNVFIGQTKTHPSNHHGTVLLKNAISGITQQYHDEFGCYDEYQRVGVNDMALEFGGVFDLYPYGPEWAPGHKTHDHGKAVDFRCKPPPKENSVIYDDRIIERFEEICELHGLYFTEREDKGKSNEHIHCAPNRFGT